MPEKVSSYDAVFGRKERKLRVVCQIRRREDQASLQKNEDKKIEIRI